MKGATSRLEKHTFITQFFTLFILIIIIILFTEKRYKKWWKTSKNEIDKEWIKIWVKDNMIWSLKI